MRTDVLFCFKPLESYISQLFCREKVRKRSLFNVEDYETVIVYPVKIIVESKYQKG